MRKRIAGCSLKTTGPLCGSDTEVAEVRTFIPSALESVTASQKVVALACFEVTNILRQKIDPVIPSHGPIAALELPPSACRNRCRLIDIDLR